MSEPDDPRPSVCVLIDAGASARFGVAVELEPGRWVVELTPEDTRGDLVTIVSEDFRLFMAVPCRRTDSTP